MAEAGNILLAEVMLWLIYIAVGIAVVTAVVSAVRSYFLN